MLQSPSMPGTPQPAPNPAKKQGTLWKWTNYLSGWQPRWFVLTSGILSYYLSPSEVKQGCRGSLKVTSCDLIVHPSDHQRLDIVAPGGRHIYVRAASTAERQQWLIALGSAKQGEFATGTAPSQEKLHNESSKTKMGELHVNCQLLITQISAIKSAVASKEPDVKTLTEMSTLVTATCDAFLNTLAECMDLSFSGGPWPASLKPLSSGLGQEASTPKRISTSGHSPPRDHMKRLPSNSFSEDELYPPTDTPSSPHPPTVATHTPSSPHPPTVTTHTPSSLHPPTVTTHTPSSPHPPTGTQAHTSPHHLPTVKTTPTTPSNSQPTLSMPLHLSGGRTVASNELSPPKRVTFENIQAQSTAEPDERTETHSSIPGSSGSKSGTETGQNLLPNSHSQDSPDLGSLTAQSHTKNHPPTDDPSCQVPSKRAENPERMDDSNISIRSPSHSNSDLFLTPDSSRDPTPPPSPILNRIGDRIPRGQRSHQFVTFFSKAPQKFEDLILLEDNGIPTADFLACCRAVIPFFDTLSATAFAPVKADINGNIEKLSGKFKGNPQLYATLQAIVLHELQTNTHRARNSATDALLWLKRAMEFIQVFIAEVSAGEQSLDVAAGKAYSKSLRRFHNWIVRGIFSLAVKAVPYHKDFLVLLGSNGSAESESAVVGDMAVFAHSLGEIMSILNQFYQKYKLDAPAES